MNNQLSKRPPSNVYEKPLICFVSKEHLTDPDGYVSSRSAIELHAYANRTRVVDHTGWIYDFTIARKNLVASQMYFPPDACPVPALQVWEAADRAAALTGRATDIISNHMIIPLPAADLKVWAEMIKRYADRYLVSMGLVVESSIHTSVTTSAHSHLQVSRRPWSTDSAFGATFYHATSKETRARWRQGWLDAWMAHSNPN